MGKIVRKRSKNCWHGKDSGIALGKVSNKNSSCLHELREGRDRSREKISKNCGKKLESGAGFSKNEVNKGFSKEVLVSHLLYQLKEKE